MNNLQATGGDSSPPPNSGAAWIEIGPPKGWRGLDLRELFEYRDLLYFLVKRDIRVLYKQTVLGFAWAILRPLVSMIVFTIVFGNLAKVDSDGVPYPLFSFVALVPWTYFSSSLNSCASGLVNNAGMLSKIYFPRLVFPLTPVLAQLVDFMIAFVVIGVLMVIYGHAPTAGVVAIPLLVLLMIATAAGAGMWLSALAVKYRDVKHALPFFVQILMYAAPVVWPASLITERFGDTGRLVYGLYPMAGVIEGFRSALLGTQPMPWDLILVGAASALVILTSGAFFFRRMEAYFADVA